MRILVMLMVLFIVPAVAFAATLNVPGDYPTIQAAIDAAAAGDVVLVAPGTYVENIDFKGKAIQVKGKEGPKNTVIDGNQSGSTVVFINGEGLDSVLEGFTITNGSGTFDSTYGPSFGYVGGGIFCGASSPTITGNLVAGNSTNGGGGIGMFSGSCPMILHNTIAKNIASAVGAGGGGGIAGAFGSSPTIMHNVITENVTYDVVDLGGGGGTLFGFGGAPLIKCNYIADNVTNRNGGGVAGGMGTTPTIESNIICNNTAGEWGGGIASISDASTISNNIVYGNSAVVCGGIGSWVDSTPIVTNNTIFGNSAVDIGGGLYFTMNVTATATNNILWENEAPLGKEIALTINSVLTISHSDVEGGQASAFVEVGSTLNWGGGMLDADPIFADAADGDFHLLFPSPCRDTGDNAAAALLDVDFEGDPRKTCSAVDMGADEFHPHLYYMGDAAPGNKVVVKVIGWPCTWFVRLFMGSGVLDPPVPTFFGDWYLVPPMKSFFMWPVGWDGLSVMQMKIPKKFSGPCMIPMQAFIGFELSNLCVIQVK